MTLLSIQKTFQGKPYLAQIEGILIGESYLNQKKSQKKETIKVSSFE